MTGLRGCVYGCGMISAFHLRGWARIPEVQIVGLGDHVRARADERRIEFAAGARTYEDLALMVGQEQPDFVDILTPPAVHRDHCRIARDAGIHVVCQKPLADTLEDARAIAADFATSGPLLAVHENHRYRPWFQKALQHDLGRIALARFEHLDSTEPAEAYKNQAATGVFLEYATHLVDMMRCALGEPTCVYARMHRLNPEVRGESLALAVYEYPTATAVVEVAWKHAAITQGSVLLTGDAGEAYFEGTLTRGDHGRLRITRGREVLLDEARSPYDDYVESFYLLQREFTDAMLGVRGGLSQTAAAHLRTLECTFAAYESASTGRIIALPSY